MNGLSIFNRPVNAANGEDFEEDAALANARGRFLGPVGLYARPTGGDWNYVNDI